MKRAGICLSRARARIGASATSLKTNAELYDPKASPLSIHHPSLVHYIDLLIWMMGNPVQVFGFADNLGHTNIEVEDCASAVLKFESGCVAALSASRASAPGRQDRARQRFRGAARTEGARNGP